jgi:hypothetical protein
MGLFGGGNSSTSSQTQNNTSTVTQDRRAVADGGSSVISADNSTIYNSSTDYGAIGAGTAIAAGGMNMTANVAQNALNNMRDVAGSVVGASSHLSDVGLSMLQANTSLANSLANGSNNLTTHVLDVVGGLYRDLSSHDAQTVGIAQDLAKTQVAAQNDNRYIIAAALAVVCIVGVMAFKGKA